MSDGIVGIIRVRLPAGVVELVDAPDSKSGARKGVPVRFRPPAPIGNRVQGLAAGFKGWMTSPRASIWTNWAIRLARVSGFTAVWIRHSTA